MHRLFPLVTLVVFFLSGCVQMLPIPGVARAGDTITLGLGGIQRNWGGAKPKNLQISITDAASQTTQLEWLTIYQAYPDYRSAVSIQALMSDDTYKLSPYDGGWFVSLTLPTGLAVGQASVHVTADNLTVKLDDQGNPINNEGDLANLPLEIIPGTSTAGNVAVTQFAAYDDRGSHFLIRPDGSSSTTLGGAYYVINYQSNTMFGDLKPIVFPVSHNPFVKINYRNQQNPDGSGTYHVYVYSTSGFTDVVPRQETQGAVRDLSVHLEYFELDVGTTMKNIFSLDTANSYYIDLNGNKVTALHPEMLHALDL